MSERATVKLEEVKNIGDAGDSCLDAQKTPEEPVCEMLKNIKVALNCGDRQSLKVALGKLEIWKNGRDDQSVHDYWRNEEVCFKALVIINKMLLVCREKFSACIIATSVLDPLLEKVHHWLLVSMRLVNMLLEVVKSLLMCGQDEAFNYAIQIISKLSDSLGSEHKESAAFTEENQLYSGSHLFIFYERLVKSIGPDTNCHECALYWTHGRSIKDLLCECLDQPYLFIYCSWPQCGVHNGMPQTFFHKCGACLFVRYCSRQCQINHWEAGHNLRCKALANRKSD
ncbi:hypothetical protein PoB_002411600 [Plakobranchus ocellatus]|uniref:MYND-type domain-containing protein n=1 Tax=Plakobranchus ocellatus TaxID=259542 RepID=A0AAV3ZEE2_9GAST|nr:hypothetical protein PoB_002411600 [Plakobranchus ocellatus]